MRDIDKILGDLPKIGGIARGPRDRNPLLRLILEQAEALATIEQWAGASASLAAETEGEAPAPVPARNGTAPAPA